MGRHPLDELLDSYPLDLRMDVRGYARWIRENANFFFAKDQLRLSRNHLDYFEMIAGIHYLLRLVRGQRRTLNTILSRFARNGLTELAVGSMRFSRGSKEMVELDRADAEFIVALEQSGLDWLVRCHGPTEIAQTLQRRWLGEAGG